jgi:hypothetical protein
MIAVDQREAKETALGATRLIEAPAAKKCDSRENANSPEDRGPDTERAS